MIDWQEQLAAAKEELNEYNAKFLEVREELRIIQHRYAVLFNLSPDGYLVTDNMGKISEASSSACWLFNVDEWQLHNKL